ncbi:MAG: PASTA domain-containing protein [Candidatus Latescibacterota bacterium]
MRRNTPDPFRRGWFRGFLVAVSAFFGGWLFIILLVDQIVMPLYLNSGREIVAPDLKNKTIAEARSISQAFELVLIEDGREFSSTVPPDVISMQIPVSGTILKPGRRIHVIVSKGPRPLRIPNVVGKSPIQAELEIKSAGLEVLDKRWKASDLYPRGVVADQYPKGDQDVPENTGVILFIANGRPETNVVMPNLIDLSFQAAMDTLSVYKFNLDKIHIQREEATHLLPDTVIDQHPDPGVPTNTNSDIDLVISTSQ